jgi:hypothetical protein
MNRILISRFLAVQSFLAFMAVAQLHAAGPDVAVPSQRPTSELAGVVRIAFPDGFRMLQLAAGPHMAYAAIGPSPNAKGNMRPAIIVTISPPDQGIDRDAFGLDAVTRAKRTMREKGLTITGQRIDSRPDETYRVDIDAQNDTGLPCWWAIRTYVRPTYAMQAYVCSFDKEGILPLLEVLDRQQEVEGD